MSEENIKPLTESEKATALNESFDATGISFHSRPEALSAFREGREVTYTDGVAHSVYDGVQMTLSDCLSRFAFDRKELVDGRTLPREGVGTSRPGIASRADLKTVSDRVAYVNAFGAEAFEKLPLQTVDSTELRTFDDWMKLPLAEKVKLTQLDNDIVSKLARTPSSRPNGVWSKPGVLDELKRKNPNYRGPGWSRDAMKKAS